MIFQRLKARLEHERPDIDLKAVESAYLFAKEAHEGQTRYSGEPYIVHPVQATEILLDLNPDLASIQACLLHDVTEDTERTLEEIEAAFGADVATLVKGCEKLAVVKVSEEEVEHDMWRKMFLAMASDLRIVFIKLSDRLHNLKTLNHVPAHKRARIAKESLEIHAKVASRLGIYQFKSEIQDLCFEHLFPEEYEDLLEQVAEHRERSEECMAFAMSQIEQLLVRSGLHVEEVQGRTKHLWSLYEKMRAKGADNLDDIYDLFAVRVILPDHLTEEGENFSHLYEALASIHEHFMPLDDRFKDYLSQPKLNGYRSLHTTVEGLGGDLYEAPTEIQIRTVQMHHEAEIGVASHADYKLGGKWRAGINSKRYVDSHRALEKIQALLDRMPELEAQVRAWVERYQHLHPSDRRSAEATLLEYGIPQADLEAIQKGRSQEQFRLRPQLDSKLASVRGLAEERGLTAGIELFPNKIFVLSPGRDVIQLTKGSTPIDFAYAIHTEVGHKMVGAKVNGKAVPLDHELQSGDQIDIQTRNNAEPSRYWLSVAKSASARAKIKNWFNKEDREANLARGRELINKQLKMKDQPILDDRLSLLKDYSAKRRNFQEREQILESVALGSITAAHVVKNVLPELFTELTEKREDKLSFEANLLTSTHLERPLELTNRVLITGEDNLPVVLSACCKPRPPQAIVGYVTRGRSIRVHRKGCDDLSRLDEARLVEATWKTPLEPEA